MYTNHNNVIFHNISNLTYINLLHFWQFNTQFCKDKFIIILLYTLSCCFMVTAADSEAEYKKIYYIKFAQPNLQGTLN